MSISVELIKLVPEGEANAVSSRVLWQQLGMWSPVSVKHTLKKMAAAGEIARKHVPHPTGEVGLYFKPKPGLAIRRLVELGLKAKK